MRLLQNSKLPYLSRKKQWKSSFPSELFCAGVPVNKAAAMAELLDTVCFQL